MRITSAVAVVGNFVGHQLTLPTGKMICATASEWPVTDHSPEVLGPAGLLIFLPGRRAAGTDARVAILTELILAEQVPEARCGSPYCGVLQ